MSNVNASGKRMNRYEAAVFLRMSPYLIKWFTKHAPKQGDRKKLAFEVGEDIEQFCYVGSLREFDRYLAEPWPCKQSERPPIPTGIEIEIKRESSYRCVICSHASGQLAHIDPVHNSKNNHPHNLIYICPNCHDLFDKKKIIKESEIRSIKKDIMLIALAPQM